MLLGRENVFTKQAFYGDYKSLTIKFRTVVLFVLSRKNSPSLQGLGCTALVLREPCSCTACCHTAELMPQATAEPSMEDPEAPEGYGNSACGTSVVQVPLWLTQKIHWLEAPMTLLSPGQAPANGAQGLNVKWYQTGFHETAQNFPTNDVTPVLS